MTMLDGQSPLMPAQKPRSLGLHNNAQAQTQAVIDAPPPAMPVIEAPSSVIEESTPAPLLNTIFCPKECETNAAAGLPDTYVEALICKHLLSIGACAGRSIARDLCLPGKPTINILTDLKNRQYVAYKGQASLGDFEYILSASGRELAHRYLEECAYCGPAPVPFEQYVDSVQAQTIQAENPHRQQLKEAFSDLLISDFMLDRLGPAINSGRGLFLYGEPGNGKTSIAERITRCFGTEIWIPFAIYADGETIQLYDPQCHVATGSAQPSLVKGQGVDPRWIKVQRPTIIVGGELTMHSLELQYDPETKMTEAPFQLKSNCGTLVIDDFGRQRMNPVELLNRWIVPLEKRFDYLTLFNGKKLQVPFDQLIVFSTNLEPRELVDDAFLRRIPYKINVPDPTEGEYRELFKLMSELFEVPFNEEVLDHLIKKHYQEAGRPFRSCHPRDLITQIINRAKYDGTEATPTNEHFDFACESYFALL